MDNAIKKRLLIQGYCAQDVNENKNIIALSRWTPFFCAVLGIIGLFLQSYIYFLILGLLTLIGPFRPWSFYDYLYKYIFSSFLKWGEMPKHHLHRRIGCAIGAAIYLTSGVGFYLGNYYLAYLPSVLIITIAIAAGIFGWCFVTAVVNLFRDK